MRTRADREKLTGFDCPECRGFYDAVLSWGGTDATIVRNMLNEVHENGHIHANGSPPGDGKRAKIVNEFSRHRMHHAPPSTPPRFWEMNFIDTPNGLDP